MTSPRLHSVGFNRLKGILTLSVFSVLFFISCGRKPAQDNGSSPSSTSAQIYEVANCKRPDVQADIVFIHGVEGDHLSSWHPKDKLADYWPTWLGDTNIAKQEPPYAVWSIGYPVATTVWNGTTMPLIDRARSILGVLQARRFHEHSNRPLIFVCHSFGGLVAKQMLRTAAESATFQA